jgi:hypothetical protein
MSYLQKRHKLIPTAERLMQEQFKGKKGITREERDYAFHRHMLVLAIKAGLQDPGCLTIFDAKKLPETSYVGD